MTRNYISFKLIDFINAKNKKNAFLHRVGILLMNISQLATKKSDIAVAIIL